jgi:hypothetical protein
VTTIPDPVVAVFASIGLTVTAAVVVTGLAWLAVATQEALSRTIRTRRVRQQEGTQQ